MRKEDSKRFCSFNCQGLVKNKAKIQQLADDFVNQNLTAMMVQETHIQEHGIHTDNKTTLHLYNSGHPTKSQAGVGIIVRSNTKVQFNPVSDRICVLTTKIHNNQQVNFISAYAPTSETTEKKPEITQKFYNKLSSTIKLLNNRDALIIGADFNAKTKLPRDNTVNNIYKKQVGRHAKSEINENGHLLLEFAKLHQLCLTNTFFKHKPSQTTTWECPSRVKEHVDSKSNQIRRNPYRNQIDYVLVKISGNTKVVESRSYNSTTTKSDHKPVIANINIKWKYTKNSKPQTPKLNIELLYNKEVRDKYTAAVAERLKIEPAETTSQGKWDKIVRITKQAAEEVVGYKDKKTTIIDVAINQLSQQQNKLQADIDATTCKTKRIDLRNQVLKKIHDKIKAIEKAKIEHSLQDIENKPNDSTKMYDAVKNLKKLTKKTPLLIIDDMTGYLTADDEEQTEIIARYFKQIFHKNSPMPEDVPPTPMTTPFTGEEIKSATSKLKNNKSPGDDEVVVELVKQLPIQIYDEIADIYNITAATGEHPKELVEGLLCALQKPGKKKGPPENLRPIILLSILRKILAVCMMNRIGECIDNEIPPNQAAYRRGRSTTEHVLATKLVIERTISAKNETVHLLMLDMSKAFDSVNRAMLIEDLKGTIAEDEIHLIKVLLGVKIAVKCGHHKSDFFRNRHQRTSR